MIKPRFWIIALAERLPWWLDWFGAWLVNRETAHILKAIGPALDGITLLARWSAPLRLVPRDRNLYENMGHNQMGNQSAMDGLFALGQTVGRIYGGGW